MLEACLKNVEEQGLTDSDAYRSIQEKFQVLSLAPQRYETKSVLLFLRLTILMLTRCLRPSNPSFSIIATFVFT
ncbi:MAG: hypothetical protein ACLTZB_05430 [Streptococcus salivarius]